MKKVFRILFLGIISLFAAITVNAATTGSIEINRTKTNYDTVYNAYRILDLSYDATNKSYAYTLNAKWSDFFTTGAGKDYVVIDENNYVKFIDYNNKSQGEALAAELAKKALAYAKANNINPINPEKTTTIAKGKTQATITGLELGYYLVDSSLGALCHLSSTDLKATINEKNAEPSIEKTATTPVEGTAKIGDKVDYKIVVNVAAGSQKYVVTDKMTAGLTFNNDINIKYLNAEGNEVTGLTSATINTTASTNYTFIIDFSDVNLANVAKIEITYSATINENAVDNNSSQSNEAKLSFGNNSNTTSSTKTITTYEALFSKVSNKKIDDKNIELDGAEFKLYDAATGGNEIKVILIDEANHIYRVATEAEKDAAVAITATNGKATIFGLGNGTYYLAETKQPEGYNILASRVEVKVENADNKARTEVTENDKTVYVEGSGGVHVINYNGAVLPTTGGLGTTLFITIGSLVALMAAVVLVTNKRMANENI